MIDTIPKRILNLVALLSFWNIQALDSEIYYSGEYLNARDNKSSLSLGEHDDIKLMNDSIYLNT